jgi:hypothetical protein
LNVWTLQFHEEEAVVVGVQRYLLFSDVFKRLDAGDGVLLLGVFVGAIPAEPQEVAH